MWLGEAAAAALGRELTVPGVAQTVTLSRVATLSTAMPDGEDLAALCKPGATLVLHLAAHRIDAIVRWLLAVAAPRGTPLLQVALRRPMRLAHVVVSTNLQAMEILGIGRHRGLGEPAPDLRAR